MSEAFLLHELPALAAARTAQAVALTCGAASLRYAELQQAIERCARGLSGLGLERGARVAIYLEKRFETVIATFAAASAGLVFVPINPLLKPSQVAHILRDCDVAVLITSPERLALLAAVLGACPALRSIVTTDPCDARVCVSVACWIDLLDAPGGRVHRVIDADMAAILYTSGSTGQPKGVVLSHRNMVAGAKSVASYLENRSDDTLLAALPLSFDAGFSQLTTAFHVGARVVLLNYLLPRDVLKSMARESVTGLTAVPPLYIQLTQLDHWPEGVAASLRYFANTGGRMPRQTLAELRKRLPSSKPYLMYGLTEAFRSTYLPPEEIDRRPDSIGKAIPNAEILVLHQDGTPCAAGEPGELVHRGALVGLGYWNDPVKTAERYRPLPPGVAGRPAALPLPEYAVYSGDSVRMDEEGFVYFIGRRDEMIKTSGYRVSPTEVEEIVYASGRVGECAAFGVEHSALGQVIELVVTPPAGGEPPGVDALLTHCRARMPAYMVPFHVAVEPGPLPRNPNGKIDRNAIATRRSDARHEEDAA